MNRDSYQTLSNYMKKKFYFKKSPPGTAVVCTNTLVSYDIRVLAATGKIKFMTDSGISIQFPC